MPSKGTPAEVSAKVAERIKQLRLCREMLALEMVPADLSPAIDNAIEHIDFVVADLQAEWQAFNLKYGLGSGLQRKA